MKRRLDQLKKAPLTPHDVISKHMANSQSRIDNIEEKLVQITERQNTDITIISNHLKEIFEKLNQLHIHEEKRRNSQMINMKN